MAKTLDYDPVDIRPRSSVTPADTLLLIVDDHDPDRHVVHHWLGATYHVLEAATGFRAAFLLRLYRPSCVVLSYPMIDMDTLAFVRACVHYQIPTVVLIKVGDGPNEAIRRWVYECIPKTHVTPAILQGSVRNAIDKGHYTPPPSVDDISDFDRLARTESPLGALLIVDDDPYLVASLTRSLRVPLRGYEIRAAYDASMAITDIQTVQPDLILLDIKLPGRVGWVVVEWLQNSVQTACIPFVVITGLMPPAVQARALACGAFACFEKPIAHRPLLEAITDALG
jgi:CheY-like chemotaxis protein